MKLVELDHRREAQVGFASAHGRWKITDNTYRPGGSASHHRIIRVVLPSFGPGLTYGAFVGEHGSWNRTLFAGYKVVWVEFKTGRPVGKPRDIVTGFLDGRGGVRGRPVGVTVDPRGALLIADDLANIVWRVTRTGSRKPTVPPKPRPDR